MWTFTTSHTRFSCRGILINKLNNIGVNPLKLVTFNPHEIPRLPSMTAHTLHYFQTIFGCLDLNWSHALTLTSAVQGLLFGVLNIPARDVSGICFGQQTKEELPGLDSKLQWIRIKASRQLKRTVWNSSGGLKCVHQTFTFLTGYNRNIYSPGVTFLYWSIINFPPPWYFQLPTARV